MSHPSESLDIHGVTVSMESHLPAVLASVFHDFNYFRVPAARAADFCVRTFPYAERPEGWRRRFRGRRSEVYASAPGEQRIRFFDKAAVVFRYDVGTCDIFGDDAEAIYEVFYLAVLSFVGERLDERDLHRIHGLGLVVQGEGMLLMGPAGTGKSTLAMRLLTQTDIALLSDDTPLVDREARIHAFPLRIATGPKPDIPDEYLRYFRRYNVAPKYVARADCFRSLLRDSAPLRWVVEMRRDHAPVPTFTAEPRWKMIWPLVRWLVIGFETQQAWEFFIRPSPRDVWRKAVIVARRTLVAVSVFRRARFFRFHLTEDPDRCFEVLRAFRGH